MQINNLCVSFSKGGAPQHLQVSISGLYGCLQSSRWSQGQNSLLTVKWSHLQLCMFPCTSFELWIILACFSLKIWDSGLRWLEKCFFIKYCLTVFSKVKQFLNIALSEVCLLLTIKCLEMNLICMNEIKTDETDCCRLVIVSEINIL